MSIFLGVNIDHIATLRQARVTKYPSLIEAARICEESGADSITLHLREDRRHIQDDDVEALKQSLTTKMNLEMAATDEMLKIATNISPEDCCLVPEKRQELTTEGGLDVVSQLSRMKEVCAELSSNHIKTSLFIDADKDQIDAAVECGAPIIEIHTGHYANSSDGELYPVEQYQMLLQVDKTSILSQSIRISPEELEDGYLINVLAPQVSWNDPTDVSIGEDAVISPFVTDDDSFIEMIWSLKSYNNDCSIYSDNSVSRFTVSSECHGDIVVGLQVFDGIEYYDHDYVFKIKKALKNRNFNYLKDAQCQN